VGRFRPAAENAAIKNKIHPEKWTRENILIMTRQLKKLGIGYDWSRELATCDPEYYRWNQWFFYKDVRGGGLAYKKNGTVNFCGSCSTVLANEQVKEGLCWRCHSEVVKTEMEQWFLK